MQTFIAELRRHNVLHATAFHAAATTRRATIPATKVRFACFAAATCQHFSLGDIISLMNYLYLVNQYLYE